MSSYVQKRRRNPPKKASLLRMKMKEIIRIYSREVSGIGREKNVTKMIVCLEWLNDAMVKCQNGEMVKR